MDTRIVIKLLKEGHTLYQIGRIVGVSESQVSKHLNEWSRTRNIGVKSVKETPSRVRVELYDEFFGAFVLKGWEAKEYFKRLKR